MKPTWPAATARRIGLRGAIDFTPSRVGLTLHVPCARGHSYDVVVAPGSHPDQVAKKMLGTGWTFGRHLLCPDHGRKSEQPKKEKAAPMSAATASAPAVSAAQAVPSDAAKRAHRLVMMLLEDQYDENAKSYRPGWTDAKVAQETGAAEAHVRETRERYFGPADMPPEVADLLKQAAALHCDALAAAAELRASADAIQRRLVSLCQSNGWPIPA